MIYIPEMNSIPHKCFLLEERVIEAGNDKIRIKNCPSIKVHIHRDIMAAENMADILVYEINGLSRPEYLSRQVVNLQKSN